MKRSALLFLAAVAAFGGFVRAAEMTPESKRAAIERAVNARFDEMLAAAEALNADALFRHVAENDRGSLVLNGRLILTRAEALRTVRDSFSRLTAVKYEVRDRWVTVLSPTSALLLTTGTTNVTTPDGQKFSRPFTHSIVWVLQEGGWCVVHSHQTTPPSS
jgi:hypothetical protein